MGNTQKNVTHTPYLDKKGNIIARLAPPGRVYKTTSPKQNLVIFDGANFQPSNQILGLLSTTALNSWNRTKTQICFGLEGSNPGVYKVTALVKQNGDKIHYPETFGAKHVPEIREGQPDYNRMIVESILKECNDLFTRRNAGEIAVERLKEKYNIKQYMLGFMF